jgi:transglutaminase-like putative cysteine protease
VNAERRQALVPPALRVAAFAALAALAAAQWIHFIEAPPVGKVALAVALLVVGAGVLVLIAARQPGRAASWALGALAALVATAAGLVAIGVPVRLLEPGGWGELAGNLSRGFSGLAGDVTYPYHGQNEWTRLVLLAGLPLALGLAAALAFWPTRGAEGLRRFAPLVVLAATFAVGATVVPPASPLLWGFLLLLGVGAWLWLPSLSTRDAIAATALIAAAGALALPIAGWLDHDEPWIDFREWEFGRDTPTSFNWDHSYGPLDWPRDGTTLFAAESDEPQYWKAAVLDRFDGTRWLRLEQNAGQALETPIQVEGARADADGPALKSKWIEGIDFTVGPMESKFVLTAGALGTIQGIDPPLLGKDGTAVSDSEPVGEGDSYAIQAYVPDPSPEQMRGAPERYPAALSRYTEFASRRQPSTNAEFTAQEPVGNVQVPLRGSDDRGGGGGGGGGPPPPPPTSPYAQTYALAQRLTATAATNYDAVEQVQDYLQRGFTYTENPPERRYPLPAFLFDNQVGYCQQFSGAMALMLRMAGIPSRVVSGFSPGTPDPDDKHRYLVEDLDAHSWVEVYFPSIGWVTFDPTPAGAPSTGRSAAAVGQIPQKELDLEQQEGIKRTRKGFAPPGKGKGDRQVAESGVIPLWSVPAGVGLVGVLGLTALAGFTVLRRARYRSLSPAAAADAHLRELPPALARLGWPIKTHETLLALERRLRDYRKLAAARYIGKLRAGRFSRTDDGRPTLAERRALRRELAGKSSLRSRLRGLLALPPGGPTRRV